MKEIICVRFAGIDDWNRPVFKDMAKNVFYGFTNVVFSHGASEDEVFQEIDPNTIEYFGTQFNCEPWGGLDHRQRVIVVPTYEKPDQRFELLDVACADEMD